MLQTSSVSELKVSVIIPVRDDVRGLRQCLDALDRQHEPPSYEVVVGLDRPSEAVRDLVARRGAGLRVAWSVGSGPYAARNAAVAASCGRVLAFVDADAMPEADWLQRGLEAVDEHGVCGGAVVPTRRRPRSRVEQYDAVMHLRQADHVESGYAATANLWVHRAIWEAVGGFDSRLLSGGDLQWGRAARAAGHPAVYVPDLVVQHRTRDTLVALARVHFRIARGWCELATVTQQLRPWTEPALRTGLLWVNQRAGLPDTDRRLIGPHLVAMAARWAGWLSVLVEQNVTQLRRRIR
jgi:GT2 family glycosyltransferase